ncbi:TPA: opacity family porin [Neisseria subflava]
MKKVLVTLIALSLPTFALADATKGFYVQADAGHATVKGDASVKGFSPRITAGYDFGDFRVAADYTHYKSKKINTSLVDAEAKYHSAGVSAIYDFDLQAPVKPYVGARVAVNHASTKIETANSYYERKETKTGIGAMAGVSYEVTPNVALDAGYRYNYWGKFDETKIHTHEVSAGVRVTF